MQMWKILQNIFPAQIVETKAFISAVLLLTTRARPSVRPSVRPGVSPAA